MTPDIRQACSKRAFDGQVRKWRRMLHEWDPEGEAGERENPNKAEAAAATTATADAATTPGGLLVSPGTKRNASNASRTPASAMHPRKQRARGGKGGELEEEEGKNGRKAGSGGGGDGGGIFADAVLVSADEAAAP